MKIKVTEKYLIGVSGGPDSIFLLDKVVAVKPKGLIVCHVNYHFRPDADLDQKIVENYCQQHNLKLEIKSVGEEFYQTFQGNFESWARKERYQFFGEVGEKYQVKNLLIAHNQNDLIETYLLQKKRNNLVNYYGLAPVSEYQKLVVIRPLLEVKKSQILAQLEKKQLLFAFDSTNEDFSYERNKIRKKLQEKDFPQYLEEIKVANLQLKKEVLKAQTYVKNHCVDDELEVAKEFKNWPLTLIQRTVYYFFTRLQKDELFQNRKRKTLPEIAKRIKVSQKNFWKIPVGDYFLVQDFQHLFFLEQKLWETKKMIVNNDQELDQLYEFNNWADLFAAIKKDGSLYPYIISNDFQEYKTQTKYYHNQRTNRYLIDHKIRYKKRILNGVVYQVQKKIILNKLD